MQTPCSIEAQKSVAQKNSASSRINVVLAQRCVRVPLPLPTGTADSTGPKRHRHPEHPCTRGAQLFSLITLLGASMEVPCFPLGVTMPPVASSCWISVRLRSASEFHTEPARDLPVESRTLLSWSLRRPRSSRRITRHTRVTTLLQMRRCSRRCLPRPRTTRRPVPPRRSQRPPLRQRIRHQQALLPSPFHTCGSIEWRRKAAEQSCCTLRDFMQVHHIEAFTAAENVSGLCHLAERAACSAAAAAGRRTADRGATAAAEACCAGGTACPDIVGGGVFSRAGGHGVSCVAARARARRGRLCAPGSSAAAGSASAAACVHRLPHSPPGVSAAVVVPAATAAATAVSFRPGYLLGNCSSGAADNRGRASGRLPTNGRQPAQQQQQSDGVYRFPPLQGWHQCEKHFRRLLRW